MGPRRAPRISGSARPRVLVDVDLRDPRVLRAAEPALLRREVAHDAFRAVGARGVFARDSGSRGREDRRRAPERAKRVARRASRGRVDDGVDVRRADREVVRDKRARLRARLSDDGPRAF